MNEGPTSNYEDVCRYVGRLFLESQREIDRLLNLQSQVQPMIANLRENLLAEQRRITSLEGCLLVAHDREKDLLEQLDTKDALLDEANLGEGT